MGDDGPVYEAQMEEPPPNPEVIPRRPDSGGDGE